MSTPHGRPLAEAKKHLSRIVAEIEKGYDRILITKSGLEKAVLLSAEEYEGLIETLDILSNKKERQAIARAKRQVHCGRTISLEEFKGKASGGYAVRLSREAERDLLSLSHADRALYSRVLRKIESLVFVLTVKHLRHVY